MKVTFAKSHYRHTHFIVLHFIALHRYCVFYKLKVCGNPVSSKSIGIFPTAFAQLVSLCHILLILAIFQTFKLLLCLLWWSVIFHVTIVIVLGHHKLHPDKMVINVVCVLTAPLAGCSPHLSPSPWASLRHNNTEIRPVNSPTMASTYSNERNSCSSLILNQKPEMIKLSEEGM